MDPLAHVLRGFRESLLQQAATALVTPSSSKDANKPQEDFDTDTDEQ